MVTVIKAQDIAKLLAAFKHQCPGCDVAVGGRAKRVLEAREPECEQVDFIISQGDFDYLSRLHNHVVYKTADTNTYCFEWRSGVRVHRNIQ